MRETIRIKVIQNHSLLTLVPIPPLVLRLNVDVLTMLLTSKGSLTSTRSPPIPETPTFLFVFPNQILLMNLFQIPKVFYIKFRRDRIPVSFLSVLTDLIPVQLLVPLHRPSAELPWTLKTSVLFHAIRMSTIVNLHNFPMAFAAQFLYKRRSLSLVKIDKILDMRCAFGSSLKLTNSINTLASHV